MILDRSTEERAQKSETHVAQLELELKNALEKIRGLEKKEKELEKN